MSNELTSERDLFPEALLSCLWTISASFRPPPASSKSHTPTTSSIIYITPATIQLTKTHPISPRRSNAAMSLDAKNGRSGLHSPENQLISTYTACMGGQSTLNVLVYYVDSSAMESRNQQMRILAKAEPARDVGGPCNLAPNSAIYGGR